MSAASDEELYAKWSCGDEQAGQQLIRRRLPGVRRVVRSLLTESDSQDAVQEVFERLARCARAGRELRYVKSFIAGIARNVVHEQLRRHRKQRMFKPHEHSLADIGPNQSAEILRLESNRLLLKALHRMPVDDQLLLALRYWEMLRTKELAAIFELNHNTLRTRLNRTEKRLRELVNMLADSPEALESTLGSFTDWAAAHRQLEQPGTERA